MRLIRKLAGFVHANGMHYNPRMVVEVPEELVRLTPIGRWALDSFSNVEAAISERGLPKFTAYNVLKFLVDLNKVFLQDAATIMIKHPERAVCPLFRLDVFQTPKFEVSLCLLQFWGRIYTVFTNCHLYFRCLKLESR
jgi:hypothetical protein